MPELWVKYVATIDGDEDQPPIVSLSSPGFLDSYLIRGIEQQIRERYGIPFGADLPRYHLERTEVEEDSW